ncbi:uncharacterized protein CLUP02_10970 [Colletotrichum lupini]|uniref:Uncharacterized protein n=1 Tax=Colletotrichum lupini TaxID=145971 RepID=A0A9Q8SZH1_9PEZI|nr:uncharacterized protein CLUP02_10970 [Colletotrichum lupini]UQC85472.1 hypothetical protein CLUP02_10970 [Colletotrichum lupini]
MASASQRRSFYAFSSSRTRDAKEGKKANLETNFDLDSRLETSEEFKSEVGCREHAAHHMGREAFYYRPRFLDLTDSWMLWGSSDVEDLAPWTSQKRQIFVANPTNGTAIRAPLPRGANCQFSSEALATPMATKPLSAISAMASSWQLCKAAHKRDHRLIDASSSVKFSWCSTRSPLPAINRLVTIFDVVAAADACAAGWCNLFSSLA